MAGDDASADQTPHMAELAIDAETSKPNGAARNAGQSAPKPQGAKNKKKTKKQEVAESWEDEDISSDDDASAPASAAPQPSAPSTSGFGSSPARAPLGGGSLSPSLHPAPWSAPEPSPGTGGPARRPETTDAVARRLIAGALGIRAPKLTDEQKAYQKALRDAEQKRKEDERAAQKRKDEETERARKAIWDD